MNERIKELAEQARDWAEVSYKKQNDQFTSHWDNPIGYTVSQFFEQKFAELIVKECMGHADEIGRLNHGRGSWHTVRDRISIKMLGIYPKSGPIMPTTTGIEE